MIRVQIPAYTDWWMRGARFGVLVDSYVRKGVEIGVVKLDANGKLCRVKLDDCQPV